MKEKSSVDVEKNYPLDRFLKVPAIRDTMNVLSVIVFSVAAFIVVVSWMLSFSGIKPMYVVSDSMVPVFSTGDLLFASNEPRGVGVGDIVVYEADWLENKSVTHTVVNIDVDTITTRGDNNDRSDPPFNRSKIIGEVIGILPKAGFIFRQSFLLTLCSVGIILSLAGSRGSKLTDSAPKRSTE